MQIRAHRQPELSSNRLRHLLGWGYMPLLYVNLQVIIGGLTIDRMGRESSLPCLVKVHRDNTSGQRSINEVACGKSPLNWHTAT